MFAASLGAHEQAGQGAQAGAIAVVHEIVHEPLKDSWISIQNTLHHTQNALK